MMRRSSSSSVRRGAAAGARAAAGAQAPGGAGPGRDQAGPLAPPAPAGAGGRRGVLGGLLLLGGAGAAAAGEARAEGAVAGGMEDGFLRKVGDKGPISDEEQRLIALRMEKEAQAMELDAEGRAQFVAALERARAEGEAAARGSQDTTLLCATPFGIDVVGITEGVALVGALVGGLSARNRKAELERVNDKLRNINLQLRKQARAGTTYAPGLTYAPTGQARPPPPPTSEEKAESALSLGRKLLKDEKGAQALVQFERARMLYHASKDLVKERRAERGLAAASRMQGQYKKALSHLFRVLEISKQMDEFTGDTDAYGAIADIYTELGDLENAGKYYDVYIAQMSEDSSVV